MMMTVMPMVVTVSHIDDDLSVGRRNREDGEYCDEEAGKQSFHVNVRGQICTRGCTRRISGRLG
jgi:hypothetical protein